MRGTRTIAATVVFWLSGLACLVVCATGCAEAKGAASHVPACCARSAAIDAEASCEAGLPGDVLRGEPSFASCCFLAARPDGRAPAPGNAFPDAPAAEPAGVDLRLRSASAPVDPAPVEYLPDRGDTHVRCCVFLI